MNIWRQYHEEQLRVQHSRKLLTSNTSPSQRSPTLKFKKLDGSRNLTASHCPRMDVSISNTLPKQLQDSRGKTNLWGEEQKKKKLLLNRLMQAFYFPLSSPGACLPSLPFSYLEEGVWQFVDFSFKIYLRRLEKGLRIVFASLDNLSGRK